MKNAIAILLLAAACGGPAPEPREYPLMPDDGSAGGERPQVLAREALRDGPRMLVQRSASPASAGFSALRKCLSEPKDETDLQRSPMM